MATITENIQTLRSIKSDIKNAIIQKGGSVTDAFGTYAQAITNLPSGGGGGTEMEDGLITRRLSGTYYNDRVSVVGQYAFYLCRSLTSINLPNCTSINGYAFYYCMSLVSINLPNCTYLDYGAFGHCDKLSSIDLQNCSYIGNSVFYGCSSLTYVNLPLCDTVEDGAFGHCDKLSSIDLQNCSYIGNSAFESCDLLQFVNLPNCISLAQTVFSRCYNLQSVNLPNCTYVSNSAFWACGLPSIDLPKCSYIGGYACYQCSSISTIKIPVCSYIGYAVFQSCNNLKEVYLNSVSTVTTISSNTFNNCPNLTSVYVPSSLVDAFKTAPNWSSISSKIVAYTEPTKYPPLVYSAKSAGSTITVNGQSMTLEQGDNIELNYPNEITSVKATGNTALTAIQIPNTVTSIENNAFADCDALSEITLPDTLQTIGDNAFEFCMGLESVNIPSGVTSIRGTFNACSALTSVTLPDTLQTIGDSAFMECTSLASITIPSSVTMIESCAFDYCEALTDFNFNGTKAQWGAITLGDGWKNNAAFTVVHCTDGDVTLEEPIQPIQHEYVDLGLPSGLKWAKCNVGAEKETDAGLYFAWGETTGYTASQVGTDKSFLWSNYKYGNDSSNLTKYNQSDGKTVLESADDAATQIMGGDWRMPTKAELQELLDNTTNEWATINGVNGMKFTSKTDTSNYIFIPAAGYCNYGSVDGVGNYSNIWSSSLGTSDPKNAWHLYCQSGYCGVNDSNRCNGMSVRGVRK